MKYRHLAVAGAVALVCSFAALSRAAEDEQQEYARARAGLAKAKLTLEQAVEAAVKKVPHGKAVEAAIENEKQGTVFEVEVISGKKHMEVQVDAATGEILGVEEEDEEKEEAAKGEDEPDDEELENEAAANSKTTLVQAIRAASKEVASGKAFDASFLRHEGKLAIEVELLDGSKVKVVHVDAQTGKLLKVKDESKN
jgi:uncharacterized membrane protein YkoI